MRYTVAVGAPLPTQELTFYSGLTITYSLTGPEIRFTIPGRSPAAQLIDGLVTDVWVYRDNVLRHRCRTLPVDQIWGPEGSDEASVTAVSYRRLVEARNIISLGALPAGVPSFVAVDQGTIIWNLIQHTQAQTGGNLGITAGTVITGVTRTRTEYKVGDNLGKLMNDLSNVVGGCWWGIDANLVLTAHLWTDFAVRSEPIVLGQTARQLARTRGKGFANVAGAIGSVTDTVVSWATSAGLATDPRGRWEVFDASHGSVILQATVTNYAQGLLAERSHPPSTWAIELEPDAYALLDYAPGEFVTIVVPASAVDELGPPPVSVSAQITEVTIALDDSGGVQVTLAAEEVA